MTLKFFLLGLFSVFYFFGNTQVTKIKIPSSVKPISVDTQQQKMQIEIWSDIMCPFCYIGKRKFEAALDQFPDKDKIEWIWKSFQLSPDMKTDPEKNINQFLAEHKGISVQEAARMNEYVTGMASKVGLDYNFEKTIVANSFNAHRFSHFARQYGKQDEAEEKLFSAYFTEGKNLDDLGILLQLGKEIGLDPVALKTALENGAFADAVDADIHEAEQIGVNGVPFFVFDLKYAVSGAQDSKVFLNALEKSFAEWKINTFEGSSIKND